MKRTADMALAFAGLVVLLPILVAIWLVVVWQSGRPGLFRQRRVGRGNRDFIMMKFRTMTNRPQAENGTFDAGSAARVTGIGRFLRKWKLDELPQLWNVLKGDMAIVGPRPEVRKWVDAYPERWARVLLVRPGITDPASVEFRNEEELLAASGDAERAYREVVLPRKLDLYEQYVADRNAWTDMKVVVRTIGAILKG